MRIFISIVLLMSMVTTSFAQDWINERPRDPIPAKVDAAFRRGLDHLAATQQSKGNWKDNHGRKPGVVGLVTVAMLARGDDPNFGPYSQPVRRAIQFLLDSQNKSNGYIGDTMYNHGFATLALAEAYGHVHDQRIGPALKNAVDLILSAQEINPRGAWRYNPESQDADTTVAGAQMVALFAARNAGLAVPDKAIRDGLLFYESCFTPGGGFGYSSAGSPNITRSAIGVLIFCLAKRHKAPPMQTSLDYIKQDLNYRDRAYPFYYEYYMAQALYQADPETWKIWNKNNVDYMISTQGSDGGWDSNNGKPFGTVGALLSLALDYRLLPIYER